MDIKFKASENIRGDCMGGLISAFVALPLALAFGVLSGAGPIAGLYSAIAVGFLASLFGGTPSQISGPTGPMTVVMTSILLQYQTTPLAAFMVVLMAGAFQVFFGIAKFGQYIAYVPYTVISGFICGVGTIMITLQLNPFTGHPSTNSVTDTLLNLPELLGNPHPQAIILGLISLSMMIFMPKKVFVIITPPLAALISGAVIGALILSDAPIIGPIPSHWPELTFAMPAPQLLPSMISAALTLAMLGSVDSLLTSLTADNYTRTRHDPNKELIGQGIGNMAAGLLGALPGAGATARTMANINAGGRTAVSGIIHSLILLACTISLGFLMQDIPRAVLAGMLMKIGWNIIDWTFIKRLWNAGWEHVDRQAVIVMMTVFILTVFVDFVIAISVGIIMEALISAKKLATHQISSVSFLAGNLKENMRQNLADMEKDLIDLAGDRIMLFKISGALSFGTAHDLLVKFQDEEIGHDLILIDITGMHMVDMSILVTLGDIIENIKKSKKTLYLSGTKNPIYAKLRRQKILKGIDEGKIFERYAEAIFQITQDLNDENESAQ